MADNTTLLTLTLKDVDQYVRIGSWISTADIAGLGISNPIGAIGSAGLMLNHLGLKEESEFLNRQLLKQHVKVFLHKTWVERIIQ